ncbi:MAG: hypothetical protein KUF72_14825 [Candidatus Thiodiazotropha sp. (ex Ctena orbiculata)]|nr:hypothetical protein [Candidatus Thiodiazotropha taylori]
MIDNTSVNCYGIRRLNPFLGVLQIIELQGGRASTTNGRVWHIESQIVRHGGWGSLNAHASINTWQLIGLWSEKEGLIKAPMVSDDWHADLCDLLIKQILQHQHELPFALTDRRELWLLDETDRKPLALLMSMQPGPKHSNHKPRFWRGCLERTGVGGDHHFREIDRLERLVRKRAGFHVNHLWLTWDVHRQYAETDQGERFERAGIPSFGLTEDWPDDLSSALVQRYLDWIAPALLTLPTLQEAERRRLESNLGRRASRIEYYWRLYPEILDRDKIPAPRVRTRMTTDNSGITR